MTRKQTAFRQSFTVGSVKYSKEELIAELTAAYLCAHCGIDNTTIENSAAYLQSWIKVLKGDNKLIVTAAAQAQKAAKYILNGGELPTYEKEAAAA